jgi:hypothetical protein
MRALFGRLQDAKRAFKDMADHRAVQNGTVVNASKNLPANSVRADAAKKAFKECENALGAPYQDGFCSVERMQQVSLVNSILVQRASERGREGTMADPDFARDPIFFFFFFPPPHR